MEELYTIELIVMGQGYTNETLITDCTLDEITKVKDDAIRALRNQAELHIFINGESVIIPYSLLNHALIKIVSPN